MTRYFVLREDSVATAAYDGDFEAAHKWGLPGVECSGCGATWSMAGHQYPGVDLSQLPERAEFEEPRVESLSEFARLRELVRPLAPPGAELPPGTDFGPVVGRAHGKFGPFSWLGNSQLFVRRDALERLQAEGVRGLVGCRTEFRFRQKNPPELLEFQIEPRGLLHPDCFPPGLAPPCTTCGHWRLRLPEQPILDAASMPTDRDLFRLSNFSTLIIGTEHFRDAVLRLGLDGIAFRELPTR